MIEQNNLALALAIAYALDRVWGDPISWPHPVVYFGKAIAFFERIWNSGNRRFLRGACAATLLVVGVFVLTNCVLLLAERCVSPWLRTVLECVLIFYGLAGTTLVREVRAVFGALERSLEDGRRQVARIVGRNTEHLTAQEVRTAALETLAENLSDGVVAPLFWLLLLGVPGMMTYKMINTMDSMVGYRSPRYKQYGHFAARLDDVANFVPARLTALLMVLAFGQMSLLRFVWKYGNQHASPNSGYPEAALAGILNCRFGGPHHYFGQEVWKPYIGANPKELTMADLECSVLVFRRAEIGMVLLTCLGLVLCCKM